MFNIFGQPKEIEEVEEELKSIDKKDMENVIELINIAYSTGCIFVLKLTLTSGEFCVDSDTYTDIKMLNKTKNEPDRVVIGYKNALLSHTTIINLDDIVGITFDIKFCNENNIIK